MDVSVADVSGLVAAGVAVVALLASVRSATKKNQAKLQVDLKLSFDEGVKEGERRMESKIDRLTSQLELRTSERDQARGELGDLRNDHRDRRGRD